MNIIFVEILVCIFCAALLMVYHELLKAAVYVVLRKKQGIYKKPSSKVLWIWKYIDPIGLIFSVCCFVPISKPHMFRIRDKKTNLILGLVGFMSLIFAFVGSVVCLHIFYGGLEGIKANADSDMLYKIGKLFWLFLAMLSFNMFIANMFPVSTFDMGLIIAGFSSRHYLQIIKSDSHIKLIFLLTLFLDLIHYGYMRLMQLFL